MKTKIYWVIRHGSRALHEFRFRARCWWLGQQVRFLEWRLRLEALLPDAATESVQISARRGNHVGMPAMSANIFERNVA